jgi:hypothetical protein
MDTEAMTGQTVYGLVPARKTNFLVGEYYSLDRCPLMGTNKYSVAGEKSLITNGNGDS